MHYFWQFSCNILLRITHKFKYVIEKGFGVEAENFGGEASPPPTGWNPCSRAYNCESNRAYRGMKVTVYVVEPRGVKVTVAGPRAGE